MCAISVQEELGMELTYRLMTVKRGIYVLGLNYNSDALQREFQFGEMVKVSLYLSDVRQVLVRSAVYKKEWIIVPLAKNTWTMY